MSWLSSFLHPDRAYKGAQDQLNQGYNNAQGYQQPFMNNGVNAGGQLNTAMNNLLNPEELQNKWAQGYKTSDVAKNNMGLANQQGLDAASSMGLMGSTPAIQAIQAGTSQIGAQDQQNYLNDLMQKYMQGVGIGQNFYNTGANAAGQMGQNSMTHGQDSANMTHGQKSSGGNMLSNIVGRAIPAAAGWALGGPVGGIMGMMGSDMYGGG